MVNLVMYTFKCGYLHRKCSYSRTKCALPDDCVQPVAASLAGEAARHSLNRSAAKNRSKYRVYKEKLCAEKPKTIPRV